MNQPNLRRLLGISFLLALNTLFCRIVYAASCHDYLKAISRTLGREDLHWDYPLEQLRKDIESDEMPKWFKSLETEILRIFTEIPPEVRSWENFQEQFDLSDEQMWDLRTYYGLNIFNQEGILDAKPELIAHARKRALEDFLKDSSHPAASRYAYYKTNLGKKSTPEMAKELKLSEGQVYRDLSLLNLSLAQAFTTGKMQPSSQAEAFARHHAGIESRGVNWNRSLDFRGLQLTETEILVLLFDEGKTYQAIANELNFLTARNVDDEDMRSEKSVSARIQTLNLARLNRLEEREIAIAPYGLVKSSGKLVPLPAVEFIVDHKEKALDWIAEQLGVEKASLRDFIMRQHIGGIVKSESKKHRDSRKPLVREALLSAEELRVTKKKFKENLAAMDNLIDYLTRDDVRTVPPTSKKKGRLDSAFDKVLGFPHYRFVGTAKSGNLNTSRLEAFTGTLNRLKTRSDLSEVARAKVETILREYIENLEFQNLSSVAKRQALEDRLINYLKEDGVSSVPSIYYARGKKQHSEFDTVLKVHHAPFLGTSQKGNLNSSRLKAFENVRLRLKSRTDLSGKEINKVTKIIDDEIQRIKFEELDDLEKRVVIEDRLIDHLKKDEVTSIPSTVRNLAVGQSPFDVAIGLYQERFTGTSASGGNLNSSRLEAFENVQIRLKSRTDLSERARSKVKEIVEGEIQKIEFEKLSDPEKRKVLEDRLIDYLKKGEVSSLPSSGPSRKGQVSPLESVLGVPSPRFVGTSKSGSNFNSSRITAMENTLSRLESRSDLSEVAQRKVRAIIEKEIQNLKFDELSDPEKRVTVEDRLINHLIMEEVEAFPTTSSPGKGQKLPLDLALGINHRRFYGTNKNGNLNNSKLEALRNTLRRLESRKDLSGESRKKAQKILQLRINQLKE